MATATLIDARVKYAAGQPREGKYGPYINVLVTLPDNSEERIFGKPDDPIKHLRKGQTVQLVRDAKGLKLVQSEQPATQPTATSPTPSKEALSKEAKRAIAAYVEEMANLYKFCWDSASTALDGKANDEESIRAASSALFISASRKFGL